MTAFKKEYVPLKIMRWENFEATRQWTQADDLFSGPPSVGYDQAALV
jgi:hypothetical protein